MNEWEEFIDRIPIPNPYPKVVNHRKFNAYPRRRKIPYEHSLQTIREVHPIREGIDLIPRRSLLPPLISHQETVSAPSQPVSALQWKTKHQIESETSTQPVSAPQWKRKQRNFPQITTRNPFEPNWNQKARLVASDLSINSSALEPPTFEKLEIEDIFPPVFLLDYF